ncbi:MAG: methyltransferase domain-containing protein [Bryobacteraceae bacterium]
MGNELFLQIQQEMERAYRPRDEPSSPAPVDTAEPSLMELAGVRSAVAALYSSYAVVGQMPPEPPTLRGRMSANLVKAVRRMLFWYSPQIVLFQYSAVRAFEEQAKNLEGTGRRLREFRRREEEARDALGLRIQQLESELGEERAHNNRLRAEWHDLQTSVAATASRAEALQRQLETEIAARDALTDRIAGLQTAYEDARETERTARQGLAAQLEAEADARESLAAQLEAEAHARESLAAQLEAEAHARESLAARLEAEAHARESLAARLETEVHARESLAARLETEVHAGESLAARLETEVHARESLAARLETEVHARESLAVRLETEARARESLAAQVDSLRAQVFPRLEREVLRLKPLQIAQDRRISVLLEEARKRWPEPFDATQMCRLCGEERHDIDAFYAALEDEFRGSREEIKERLTVYLPKLMESGMGSQSMPILDAGCGRGEWLELLRDRHFEATGIDLNRVNIAMCRERGLPAQEAEAVAYLQSLPDASLGMVTAFHLIEHLPLRQLLGLLDAVVRTLKPGGLAIFETPNPNNVWVGTRSFYLDPTHHHPIPPQLGQFLAESRGLRRVEIMELHPWPEAHRVDTHTDGEVAERFNEYFYGPQDYAIIGWKV